MAIDDPARTREDGFVITRPWTSTSPERIISSGSLMSG
jgi:hypothetical protein